MKRPFLVSGITLIITILICETLGYYGYGKVPLIIGSVISAIAGAILFLSIVPDTEIKANFKEKMSKEAYFETR